MRDAARRFAHLGFGLAEPLSFGRPRGVPVPSRSRRERDPTREVVVLGGGYTAVWAARALARRLRAAAAGVARHGRLGDDRTTRSTAGPAEVLSGHVRVERARGPRSSTSSRRPGWCTAARAPSTPWDGPSTVDDRRRVTRLLPYDHLLVATGLARRARARARSRRARVVAQGRRRARGARRARLDAAGGPVVVVGGGLAGTRRPPRSAARLRAREPAARVVLVHGGRAGCSATCDRGSSSVARLRGAAGAAGGRRGRVRATGRAGRRRRRACSDDGTSIPAATVVSAVGQAVGVAAGPRGRARARRPPAHRPVPRDRRSTGCGRAATARPCRDPAGGRVPAQRAVGDQGGHPRGAQHRARGPRPPRRGRSGSPGSGRPRASAWGAAPPSCTACSSRAGSPGSRAGRSSTRSCRRGGLALAACARLGRARVRAGGRTSRSQALPRCRRRRRNTGSLDAAVERPRTERARVDKPRSTAQRVKQENRATRRRHQGQPS